jgi:hypothetical protein
MSSASDAQNEVNKLIGLPLTSASRAAAMVMFGFGAFRDIPDDRRGGMRRVADFALHVDCPWRIYNESQIVVGSQDIFYPWDSPWTEPVPVGFDWDVSGANRCDHFFESFIKAHPPLIVESVAVDRFGSLHLSFSSAFGLDVFPNIGTPDEVWRLFRPGAEEPHFVMGDSSTPAQAH